MLLHMYALQHARVFATCTHCCLTQALLPHARVVATSLLEACHMFGLNQHQRKTVGKFATADKVGKKYDTYAVGRNFKHALGTPGVGVGRWGRRLEERGKVLRVPWNMHYENRGGPCKEWKVIYSVYVIYMFNI